MRKNLLQSFAISGISKKYYKTLLVLTFIFLIHFNSFAHRVEIYTFSCVSPNQNLQIDAVIVDADNMTWYQWQFLDGSGNWQCFVDGMNTINNVDFNVTGSAAQNQANDAPLLTIENANSALENVLIRVLLRESANPCNAPAGTTYNGDDLALNETKYLRLHVFSNASLCPPNAYLCDGNTMINSEGYFGGFENKIYNAGTDSYASTNFSATAGASDFSYGIGAGTFQEVNNPYAKNLSFARNIAPHTGNFQLVVEGSANTSDKAWYKSVLVTANTYYEFAVWAARVDDTDPIITLTINGTVVQTYDLSEQPIGNWWRIKGQYRSLTAGTVEISVADSRAGASNNYSLDDICFRECFNCSTLPLHNLDLRATLNGSTVGLKWTAENEMNTNQFIIERSLDGISFSSVVSQPALGQTNTISEYKNTDNIQSITNSILYYRVKAIDLDGRYKYSNVVTVRLNKNAGIQVWPNPFRDNISITYNAAINTKVDITILNSAGKQFSVSNFNVYRGLNQLSVNNLGAFPSGIYILRITDKNSNETYIQKLSK